MLQRSASQRRQVREFPLKRGSGRMWTGSWRTGGWEWGLPWIQHSARVETAALRLVPCCRDAARRARLQAHRALGARAAPPLSAGAPPDTAGMRKLCVGARSAQRVFPAVGNQEGSFWAETKDKHLKSIHRPASAPGRVCTYGHTSRQKERLCAYTHTPHLCLRHPPVFFFSRQGFHELQ